VYNSVFYNSTTLGPACNTPPRLYLKKPAELTSATLFINPDKCKVMTAGVWNKTSDLQSAGSDIEKVDDYCYLASYMSYSGSCEKAVSRRSII